MILLYIALTTNLCNMHFRLIKSDERYEYHKDFCNIVDYVNIEKELIFKLL